MGKLILVVLHNLWLLFVFVITSFEDLTVLAAGRSFNEDVKRRKLQATQKSPPGFISIDCGVEDDYFDEATGIFFKSDKDFISSGENHEIYPEYESNNDKFGKRYKTLRSFPNGRKNCYNITLENAKNNSFRIRASFSYGNYDGKIQLPKFDLYTGVNYWTTVETNFTGLFYEIIHVFRSDTEYVCLVNTGFGTPLISALEIRPSNYSINGTGSLALISLENNNLGSNAGQDIGVRYKDDIYDRVWYPFQLSDSVPITTSLDIDTQSIGNMYKVPVEVLRTAVQPSNGSKSLTYSSSFHADYEYNVYFYFAEFEDLGEDQQRELSITLNGIKYGPVTLEYLKPLSISVQKLKIEEKIVFTIDSTNASLLPILNAFEVYQLLPFQQFPTYPSDVDAIMSIKHAYNINRNDWQGDPCLPKQYSWSGLSCKFNSTPRIISMNLSSSKLTGDISPSLVDLQAIESIDLSYNELTGSVPEVLARLPNLKVLNLSGNKLKGPIPRSLKEKIDNGSLLLSFNENELNGSFNENENPCHCEENNKKFNVPLVASLVSALALVILLSFLIIFCILKRRQQAGKEGLLESKNRPFTYSEIVRITANFKNKIGEGGFGKVFLGHLNDDTPVAVKLLSSSSKQADKEFQAEAQLLMIVHHKNLVSLIGYCKEDDDMALIYEFLSNGNLRQHLSAETNKNVLNWKQRLQIAIDAAQGLDYLHNGCKPPIVHRDLKPSNILLGESMQAKIADFGLSRVFSTETASHISTCPAGTLGYLDPEVHASGNFNKKSDVYSFGIILLELITGRPVIIRGPHYDIHILHWVSPIIEEGDIQKIVDPMLETEFNVGAAWKAVEVAMSCVLPTSIQRPDISLVLAELKECLALEMAIERNDQRVQGEIIRSSNSMEMTSLEIDSDMIPIAR